MILSSWTKDQSIGTSSWTTVYSLNTVKQNVYGFVLHVSSEKVLLRFEAPGISWEMDLEEISKDYMLDTTASKQVPSWIYSTGQGRYAIEFREPLQLQGELSIKLKSKSGTKTMYLGFLSRGLR